MKCAGVQISGYWKGFPCGASPVIKYDGKDYCANHAYTAQYHPERFEKAIESARRRAERNQKWKKQNENK